MADKNVYKMDAGSWLESDKKSGSGRGTIGFVAPSWKGREDRITIRIVQKKDTESMRALTFKQKGVKITDISVNRIDFPIGGGDKQILVTTNAAALSALITSENRIKGYIKAFTTASGLNIGVNDIKVDYGFPGDPGLEDTFQVSLIVSMPSNFDGDEVNENITINGVLIPIYQPGKVVPYIKLDKEFEQIEYDETSVKLAINSNLDNYKIEIEECSNIEPDPTAWIKTDKEVINLDNEGTEQTFNVITNPDDLKWEIRNKQ